MGSIDNIYRWDSIVNANWILNIDETVDYRYPGVGPTPKRVILGLGARDVVSVEIIWYAYIGIRLIFIDYHSVCIINLDLKQIFKINPNKITTKSTKFYVSSPVK